MILSISLFKKDSRYYLIEKLQRTESKPAKSHIQESIGFIHHQNFHSLAFLDEVSGLFKMLDQASGCGPQNVNVFSQCPLVGVQIRSACNSFNVLTGTTD
jgi:hypothetical protein